MQERAILSVLPVASEDWRSEIVAYLNNTHQCDDEALLTRMSQQSRQYKLVNGELYKEGVCAPLLKCLAREEGKNLMREVQLGMCGSHIGPRKLLGKIYRTGFYWPKAEADAEEICKTCDNCQKMSKHQNRPAHYI